MRVAILSDSHDNDRLLAAALDQAVALGATAALHCGDVVAANTLRAAGSAKLPLHVIHGNNTGDLFTFSQYAQRDDNDIHYHGQDAALELAGRRIFLVHYPHYAHAMAATGDWDLVCCGHSHQSEIKEVANIQGAITYLVNPGTVGGVGAEATFVLADLESLSFEIVSVVATD